MTIETTRTATHEFYVSTSYRDLPGFKVEYRPLNPKTGEPWQASRHLNEGADLEHPGYEGRPNAYTTVEKARAAVALQAARLAKGRGR